ncbi:hypothetical protein [Yersinia enterocolitica]|uniref:hypothetical protein n=1 Tax=Yersinia enterocolitica TaxID=630 RepID=UPI0005040DB5|nr:hypothetical protein [Yersinia enterocolitica]ELI8285200.1 hypothetical protein [Yersinia enterocolitica]KGA79808.1 hypothetical protein DJ60_4295 [Yersinia enterocolitica]MCE3130003.1 hypothetical protein [Yersinia enterocolitica]HDL6787163.1 hypothetical protein [Yersinia enterocolitica]HDL8335371.1 hypothetical protein [Yersinia enterocolitica]
MEILLQYGNTVQFFLAHGHQHRRSGLPACEPVIQRELEIREERLMQEREHRLSLDRERQLEIQERTLDGLSL